MDKQENESSTEVKVGLTGRRFTVRSVAKSEDKLYDGEGPGTAQTGTAQTSSENPTKPAAENKLIADDTNSSLHQANGDNKPMFQIGAGDTQVDPRGRTDAPSSERNSTGFICEVEKSTTASEGSSDGDETKPLAPFDGYKKSDDSFIPITVAEKKYGDGRFGKFADSFKSQCRIQQRKSPVPRNEECDDIDGEESMSTIVVPVPSNEELKQRRQTLNNSLNDTLIKLDESHYETQKSLTKLFQENHKSSTSLASVGRFFGSRQKMIESTSRPSTPTVQMVIPPKKPQRRCECASKPTIVGVVCIAAIIIILTIVTHTLFEKYQDEQAEDKGYIFAYKTRELFIYAHADSQNVLAPEGGVKLVARLGRNLGFGLPYNCTNEMSNTDQANTTTFTSSHQTPLKEECYRWNRPTGSTLNIKLTRMDESDISSENICLHVKWVSKKFDPTLEDCIEMGADHGQWYGGMINASHSYLQSNTFPASKYQPGEFFGPLTERFWYSTHGIAITAPYDFPLHLRISDEEVVHNGDEKKIVRHMCFSSWYGYKKGTRKLEYSICRASNFMHVFASAVKSRPQHPTTGNAAELLQNLSLPIYQDTINVDPSIGNRITPYIEVTSAFSTYNATSTAWIKNSDLEAPELFFKYGTIVAMLNTSDTRAIELIQNSKNDSGLLFLDDIFPAEITGVEEYPLNEITSVFQLYLNNFIAGANVDNRVVFVTTASGSSETGAIFVLPRVNSLTELIQAIVQASLSGYKLISSPSDAGLLSNREFIRYFQIVSFLPSILINSTSIPSSGPYKDAYDAILEFRNKTVLKTLSAVIKDNHLQPVYKPIWWCFPKAHDNVQDQFIFHEYMVAPIADNSTSRLVYFPPGLWKQYSKSNQENFYHGPSSETVLEVELELLIFKRISLNDPHPCFP